MTISLVNHFNEASTTYTTLVTGAHDTTGADFIGAFVGCDTGTPTLVDSLNTSYTGLTAISGSGGVRGRLFYFKNPAVGSATWTTGVGLGANLCVAWFSGVDTSAPFDVESGTANSSTPGSITAHGGSAPTLAGDNELLLFGSSNSNDVTSVDVGTLLDHSALVGGQHYAAGLGYQIQTTGTTRNPTWNTPGQSAMAAFIAASGGGDTLWAQSCM